MSPALMQHESSGTARARSKLVWRGLCLRPAR